MILVFGIWIVIVPGIWQEISSIQDTFEGKIGTIMFRDGSKSVIRGIGTVDIPRLPVFEDVWYVDGLKANLLCIS